jgi:protein-disulfide isomerase
MLNRVTRRALRTSLLPVIALVLIASLSSAACGGDDDAGASTSAPAATKAGASPSPTATRAATVTGSNSTAQKLSALAVPVELANGADLGASTAKVTLTMYEDFQCPHCLNYTVTTEPMIVDEYVKTGKVKLEFRNLPILGQESVLAAIAGYCAAEQNKFWQLHKSLFMVQAEANQLTAEKTNVGRFSAENLLKYATEAGVDPTAFTTCSLAQTTIDALTQQLKDASTLGFRGTPSFALNGVAQSGQPASLDAWRKFLDDAVAKAK